MLLPNISFLKYMNVSVSDTTLASADLFLSVFRLSDNYHPAPANDL